MKSKTVLAVLLAMVLVAAAVASAAAAAPSQAVSTDTPTATLTGTPGPTETPSPVPTTNPCAASGGTSTGGTPVAVGTSTGGDSSEGGNQSNPVAGALCNFFSGPLGIDLTLINTLHSDGFGYGEIAQACWMALMLQTNNTTGDSTPTCQDILNAKQGNNIGSLNLGGATNWGQLKKFVLGMHHGLNLGAVVSGRAVGLFNGTSFPGNGHGHGQGGNPGNGHGHGQGGGH